MVGARGQGGGSESTIGVGLLAGVQLLKRKGSGLPNRRASGGGGTRARGNRRLSEARRGRCRPGGPKATGTLAGTSSSAVVQCG